MGWLIALGVLTLLAIMPIGVSAFYDADGPRVFAVIGPARILLFPSSSKEKKRTKEKKTEKKQHVKAEKPQKTESKSGGSVSDFLPLVDVILDFLGAFRKKLRVVHLNLKLILAGDDPADLAQNYGRAWTALGNLVPLLNNVFVIKKQNLDVECNFLADKTTVVACLDLSITIGRLFWILGVQGIPILREFLKIMNKRKGGAKA